MKSPLIPWLGLLVATVVAFAIGRATAPSIREPAAAVTESHRRNSSGPSSATEESPQARSRDRGETQTPKEPRVSIPLPVVVRKLKTDLFGKDFSELEKSMDEALPLLGATPREIQEIKALLITAETRIFEEEKRHIKVVDVTPMSFRLDASAMQAPVDAAALALKDGIRATLPAVEAEALVSAIRWEIFYRIEQSSALFEIERRKDGGLIAYRRSGNVASGESVNSRFPDDGTPIPADQVFGERWKPIIKGLTLLPVDEK